MAETSIAVSAREPLIRRSARAAAVLEENPAGVSSGGATRPRATLSPRVSFLLSQLTSSAHARHRIEGRLSIAADDMCEPIVVRRALGFALMLREMPVYIQEGETLVGGRTIYGTPYEAGTGVFAGPVVRQSNAYFPTYATREEEDAAGMRGGSASNHNAIGYGRILSLGIDGLRQSARERRAALSMDTPPLAADDIARRLDFLRAVDICLEALGELAGRYAALARKLCSGAPTPARANELAAIADTCERVASNRPTTFREALQLFLFTRIASLVESYGCMPLGRFDQYLWPFLDADLRSGAIDRREALELVECLFIKLNEEIDLSTTDDCQRLMISGQTQSGADATNELSLLCLDAATALRLPSPKVGVRLHAGTPPQFLKRVVKTIKLGIAGLPEIYNDGNIVPGLVSFGIPPSDALDYCHDGCAEITIGGKCDFYPVWCGVRLLGILRDYLMDPETPAPSGWPELLAGYKSRLRLSIAAAVEKANRSDSALGRISPAPFMSATIEGCIETGLDKTWGGTIYNMTGLLGSELVNAANSLAAIKQVVYDESAISLAELKSHLDADFSGVDGERLRLRLRNRCPKFGNGDERVDGIAADIAGVFIEEGQSHANPRGGRFCPGFYDFGGWVGAGRQLGATPDGRRAGEDLASHIGPVGGTDRNGVTAVIRSVSRVTSQRPPMGTMLDIRLHPTSVGGEDGAEKLEALLRTFQTLNGDALQFNIIDGATLKAAQAEPDRYGSLLVRVWGFSAYFVELSSDFQQHIIERTEHEL